MPTSKKQMTKLNQVKKAKAEALSQQDAAGSQSAKKKLKKLEKKLKWAVLEFSTVFLIAAMNDMVMHVPEWLYQVRFSP